MTSPATAPARARPSTPRDRIVDFHNLYVRHLEARDEGNSDEAHRILMDMADGSLAVQRDLDKVGQGIIVLKDAPALGGQQYATRLVDVVLTDLAEQYNIRPAMIEVMLRQAAGAYEDLGNQPETAARSLFGAVGTGAGFLLLLPVRIGIGLFDLTRRHLVVAGSVLGIVASALTILRFAGIV